MKVVIKNFKLLELLKRIAGCVDKTSKNTAASNILLKIVDNKLFCIAINEYMELVTYDILDDPCDNFEFIVAHDLIYNITKKINLTSSLLIKRERKYIEIFADNCVFKIMCSVDVFPSFEFDNKCIFKMKINTSSLIKMFKNVRISVSVNNPQRFLNGVFFDVSNNILSGVASDGVRLSYFNILHDDCLNASIKLILPKITINELLNIFSKTDVTYIIFFDNQVKFITNNVTLTSRLINDIYYTPVLNFNLIHAVKLKLKTADVLNALESINSIKTSVEKADFLIVNDKIIIKAGTFNQNVTIFLSMNQNIANTEFGFNYKHFTDILKLFEDDFFELIISDDKTFIIVKEFDANFFHVMMAFNI